MRAQLADQGHPLSIGQRKVYERNVYVVVQVNLPHLSQRAGLRNHLEVRGLIQHQSQRFTKSVVSAQQKDAFSCHAILHDAPRRAAAVSSGKLTPWLPLAGDPSTAPSAHRGTKLQTLCTQRLRSACVSYRPPLAAARLCNPLARAPSCQSAPLQSALRSPRAPPTLPSRFPLGTSRGRAGLQVAPGVIAFVLRTSF